MLKIVQFQVILREDGEVQFVVLDDLGHLWYGLWTENGMFWEPLKTPEFMEAAS